MEFGNQSLERIEHVKIGARIEIGSRQRGRGVQHQQIADSAGRAC